MTTMSPTVTCFNDQAQITSLQEGLCDSDSFKRVVMTTTPPYPDLPIDAAIWLGRQGYRVAPVSPNSKVPSIRDWVKAATTDEATINGWFNDLYHANDGVCIVTGRESGVWVLDVDVANGKEGK